MTTHTLAACFASLTFVLAGSAAAVDAHKTPAVGRAQPAPMPIEYYPMTGVPPDANLPFSEAVRVGDMLYLSGEIGTDKSGNLVEGGIAAQARQTMDNIGTNLARHASSFERVIQCTVALADIADWPAFNAVYRGYFTRHFPARMAYAASGLAQGARVEVQCNAVASGR